MPFWEWKGAGSPWGHTAAGAAGLIGDTFGVPILTEQTLSFQGVPVLAGSSCGVFVLLGGLCGVLVLASGSLFS